MVFNFNAPPSFRSAGRYWLRSLLKSEGGLSTLVVDFTIVAVKKEVDFVPTQTFLFAYNLRLFDWTCRGIAKVEPREKYI